MALKDQFRFKLAGFLFKNLPFIYKPLYFAFKNLQDAYQLKLISKYIKKGDQVLDIGANIGYYSIKLAQMVGNTGTIHCFEPDPTNFNFLEKNTQGYSNIFLNNSAVSDKSGKLTFYQSTLLNVDHRAYKPDSYTHSFDVNCIAIDDYINKNQKISFIKMDIQGYEYAALLGMEQLLKRDKPSLLMEFWPYGFQMAGTKAETVYQYLKNLNYDFYLIEKSSIRKCEENEILNLPISEEAYFNFILKNNIA